MKTISLDSKFRGVNSNCFTGRKEGQEARKELRLDEKDRDSETYSIMIPASKPRLMLLFISACCSRVFQI